MKPFATLDIEKRGDYLKLLSAVSKLSGLFSDSATPFINYRVAENVFCRSFGAENLSRSDTAFDANYNSIGVGLKTFICNSQYSLEKIAEFNTLSRELSNYNGKQLAKKLAEFRNDRIDLAYRTYNIKDSLYHIVARREHELVLFETDYDKIEIDNIHSVTSSKKGIQFRDNKNYYNFNFSKSTLFRRFYIPNDAFRLPVEILDDPYTLLLELEEIKTHKITTDKLIRGQDYVILPLYGYKGRGDDKAKFVFEKSGLNQWNASGRPRDAGEMYIPIPKKIHQLYPSFFPPKDTSFNLRVPTGEVFSASVCQQDSKALMTNPNKALSDWLLRKVLGLKEGELFTIEKAKELGFDSVIIYKTEDNNFKIDKAKSDSYEDFIDDN